MTQTLLKKAKSVESSTAGHTRVDGEMVELALAWLRDEVSISAAPTACGPAKSGGSMYIPIARGLRQAYRQGRLVDKEDASDTVQTDSKP